MSYSLKKIKSREDLDFFRQISEPIKEGDNEITSLIKGMFDIIYKNNAIGMAGVMAGVHKRVIVVDLQENNKKQPLAMINPEIISHSEKKNKWF